MTKIDLEKKVVGLIIKFSQNFSFKRYAKFVSMYYQ